MLSHPIYSQNNIDAFQCQKNQVGFDDFATQFNWHVSDSYPPGVAIMYDPFVC
jgi:hypothetical protein